jgi:hypothetical protein
MPTILKIIQIAGNYASRPQRIDAERAEQRRDAALIIALRRADLIGECASCCDRLSEGATALHRLGLCLKHYLIKLVKLIVDGVDACPGCDQSIVAVRGVAIRRSPWPILS